MGESMMKTVELTKREWQIAELFAWGATKKDVANRLYLSVRTVENHARSIFGKTGCTKINELSAWWFCTTFHISFDLSPLKRGILSVLMGVLLLPQMVLSVDRGDMFMRTRGARTCARVVRGGRRMKDDDTIYL